MVRPAHSASGRAISPSRALLTSLDASGTDLTAPSCRLATHKSGLGDDRRRVCECAVGCARRASGSAPPPSPQPAGGRGQSRTGGDGDTESSKPTTATSSGTRRLRRRRTWQAPWAMRSLAANTPSVSGWRSSSPTWPRYRCRGSSRPRRVGRTGGRDGRACRGTRPGVPGSPLRPRGRMAEARVEQGAEGAGSGRGVREGLRRASMYPGTTIPGSAPRPKRADPTLSLVGPATGRGGPHLPGGPHRTRR